MVVPMTTRELGKLFATWEFPPDQIPRGVPARLLVGLLRLYAERGLVDIADPSPLCRVCPNAGQCWETAMDARRDGPADNGGLCLPWVGPDYRPGGVVIVAVNPNIGPGEPTDLLLEHGISYDQHIASLQRGEIRNGRSRFAFGAHRSAAGLLDALDGEPALDRRPEQLPGAVLRTARIQAVKCVPDRSGSTPTPAMWRDCPDMLLAAELDVLRPGAVLVLGEAAGWAVAAVEGFADVYCRSERIWRGRLSRGDWRADVYGVAHPGARGGLAERSERALLQHLARTSRQPRTPMIAAKVAASSR